jgi:hypothetical protein
MKHKFNQLFIQESKSYGSLHPDLSRAIMKRFGLNEGFVVAVRKDESSEWRVVHRHYKASRKTLGKLSEILSEL